VSYFLIHRIFLGNTAILTNSYNRVMDACARFVMSPNGGNLPDEVAFFREMDFVRFGYTHVTDQSACGRVAIYGMPLAVATQRK